MTARASLSGSTKTWVLQRGARSRGTGGRSSAWTRPSRPSRGWRRRPGCGTWCRRPSMLGPGFGATSSRGWTPCWTSWECNGSGLGRWPGRWARGWTCAFWWRTRLANLASRPCSALGKVVSWPSHAALSACGRLCYACSGWGAAARSLCTPASGAACWAAVCCGRLGHRAMAAAPLPLPGSRRQAPHWPWPCWAFSRPWGAGWTARPQSSRRWTTARAGCCGTSPRRASRRWAARLEKARQAAPRSWQRHAVSWHSGAARRSGARGCHQTRSWAHWRGRLQCVCEAGSGDR
mmetsp:Transcript_124932/g.347850  ORF Transcript_124932/g.347850 Transcript_124932/m.347850 type:complete len:292 (+) Transcript_124932:162-1037(+)